MRQQVISQFGHPRGLLGDFIGRLMAVKNRPKLDWTLFLLDVQPTDHVLEIGYGPGVGIQQTAKRAEQGFVAGLDYSKTMFKQASRRNKKAIRAGHVELKNNSVLDNPYPANSFDKVFAINSSQFWPEQEKAFSGLYNVLKPGGMIAITRLPYENPAEARVREIGKEINQLLKAAGFQDTEIQFKPMKPVMSVCVTGHK